MSWPVPRQGGKRPALFSLTVPTGGGKTLSSLAFALEHAKAHGKRRIIHVIPYTSIIEQTADIFRNIFGDAVIEHHSNAEADPARENHKSAWPVKTGTLPSSSPPMSSSSNRCSPRTSRCRKLHNIVDSVVVLDEAQLLPPEFLQPILDVLNLLTDHYGVTVVLSTATQPALSTRAATSMQGRTSTAWKTCVKSLPTRMRSTARWNGSRSRCRRTCKRPPIGTPWPANSAACDSVLAIVNRRNDARELWQRMPAGTMHLSALMCGAHRSQVIASIKARMKAGIPTRVISTQLVEAGVDVDFPVVYRALAGLDSIAQAAGRCNREGKLERGKVVVFVPPVGKLPDMVKKGVTTSITVLHGASDSPLTRPMFARFFEQFYYACDLDKQQIRADLKMNGKLDRELAVDFRTAAQKFKLVEDEDRVPVVVLYRGLEGSDDSVDKWLATLRKEGPQRWLMRKLQRYTVNIHSREALKLQDQGDIEEVMPGLYVQVGDWLYDESLGLVASESPKARKACIV
jgi:CRISPR-associated endonuclease/helicase Cas3